MIVRPESPRCTAALLAAVTALVIAVPAQAASLNWMAPARTPRTPFRVGLVALDDAGVARESAARASATGARLDEGPREGPVRTFFVVPQGAQAVELTAEEGSERAVATVAIGPPAARVEISASPATPVKGQDATAQLSIVVLGEDGNPDPVAPPPVLASNVGTLEDLRPLGAGRFAATYQLPKERHPEVAIVVAFAPWPHADSSDGALGALAVPLASAVTLPGKTEKRARIALEIAGKTFGPAQADEQGAFQIPIVVPPGHRFATAHTTDPAGNQRSKQFDLHLPPTDQIACVASPASLPADGVTRARILCTATDPMGKPVAGAKLTARARLGRLDGPAARGGAYEWQYTAPLRADAAEDVVDLQYPAAGPQSQERLAIAFRPMALTSAEVTIEPQPVFAGTSAVLRVSTKDAQGREVPVRVELSAERGAVEREGERTLRYRPPADLGTWRDRITGWLLGNSGVVPARLRVSWKGAQLLVRAQDVAGEPVEKARLVLGDATAVTARDGVAALEVSALASAFEALEVHLADRPALQARAWRFRTKEGPRSFPEEGPFEAQRVSLEVALAPAPQVDVRLEWVREPAVGLRARVLEPGTGKPLRGRKLGWRVRAGATLVVTGPAREEADGAVFLPIAEPLSGAASAAVTDLATGVTASLEAAPP